MKRVHGAPESRADIHNVASRLSSTTNIIISEDGPDNGGVGQSGTLAMGVAVAARWRCGALWVGGLEGSL